MIFFIFTPCSAVLLNIEKRGIKHWDQGGKHGYSAYILAVSQLLMFGVGAGNGNGTI